MPLPPNLQNRGKPKCAAELTQAKALQGIAYDMALKLKDSAARAKSANSRIRLARALRDVLSGWDTARDAVRVLRGRGLPRSVLEKPRKSKSKPLATMDDDAPAPDQLSTPKATETQAPNEPHKGIS